MTFNKVLPLSSIADNYDLIMFDLWGVFIEGDSTYRGTVEAINNLMKSHQVVFVSNSPRLADNVSNRMNSFGLNCVPSQMFTSGEFAKELLENDKIVNSPCLYHLSTNNYPSAAEYGIKMTNNLVEANILLLTCQLEEGDDLTKFNDIFKEAVDKGIICVCSNPDKIIPNRGRLRYCPGYFAEIYKEMGGKVVYTGKPGKDLFIDAMNSCNITNPKKVLMIGDTLDTDILGANNLNIDSGLVITGNISRVIEGCSRDEEKLYKLEEFCKKNNIIPTVVVDITR